MATVTEVSRLYQAHRSAVEIVDVPELGYLMVDGAGAPADPQFAAAAEALYTVACAAHFALRKQLGAAPKVAPLEALWWVDNPGQGGILAAALDHDVIADSDRGRCNWRTMIVQPESIDAGLITRVLQQARADKHQPALDRLRYQRWTEGRCAQILHIGQHGDKGPSIVRLHQGIDAAGYRPSGRHHEIYLADPHRSSTLDRFPTILRHPIRYRLDPPG